MFDDALPRPPLARVDERPAPAPRRRPGKTAGVYLNSAVPRAGLPRAPAGRDGRDRSPLLGRARAWSAAHAITTVTRVVTDNGSAQRSAAFARAAPHIGQHQRILAEELLDARPPVYLRRATSSTRVDVSDIESRSPRSYPPSRTCRERSRSGSCTTTTIGPTPPPGNQPPTHRIDGVTNVTCSYIKLAPKRPTVERTCGVGCRRAHRACGDDEPPNPVDLLAIQEVADDLPVVPLGRAFDNRNERLRASFAPGPDETMKADPYRQRVAETGI